MAKATAEENRRYEEQYRRDRLQQEPSTCVSCGLPIEMTTEGYWDHKCPESHENRMQGTHRRGDESPVRTQSPVERYAEGFRLMRACEDE